MHFKKNKLKCTISDKEAPRVVKTKFREDQPLVIVKVGLEYLAWWANWSSLNSLIDLFGSNEENMKGKEINLVLIQQAVKGEMKNVIYTEQAMEKIDSEDKD